MKRSKRETKAKRFNVYANLCDGRGYVRTTAAPVLARSIENAKLAAFKLGAVREPMVVTVS
jgi:hypothetical protein